MMDTVAENALIAKLSSLFPRIPDQMNRLHESDAELVRLSAQSERYLALTTDSIVEEIEQGVYVDPYQIGWMTVMANLSDLAAVGAKPIGLLLSETIPHDVREEYLSSLQEGIRDACCVGGTGILGGDTNRSDRLHMSATAIGLIDDQKPMMRIGCLAGDILYCTGSLGAGNAFAAERILESKSHGTFLPAARVREGLAIRTFASACMDTSDGFFATLDQLGRLNNVGFHLDESWEEHLDESASGTMKAMGIEPWMLLAGPHGEYQLIVSVKPRHCSAVESLDLPEGQRFRRLGTVVETTGITLPGWGKLRPSDLARIRNYPITGPDKVREYVRFLFSLESECRKSTQA